ncbi:MAG: Long-chain-fatty-acid--CoA ligase [SAR116 cluster bacterium MED-G04]|nr:MAG: Long-chain-fatty-acid--CoA ligase [SAR116 cluster bacterium MED-G04]
MNDYDDLEKNRANFVPLSPLSLISRTAALYPDRQAVVHGDRSYTWADVFSRCRQLSSGLKGLGIGRGDTVAVMAANTPEMIECHYGVAASGGVLNTINTRLDPDTIAYILQHGEARVLICDTAFSTSVEAALKSIGDSHGITVIDIADSENASGGTRLGKMDYEALLESGDPEAEWSLPGDEWDALALNYTSGTSGRPKGVVYHHRGSMLMTMGTIADWQMPRHLSYLYTVPLFHCNGWGHVFAVTALAGTLICNRAVTPKAIYDAIADHGVTHFGGAPIVLGMIINADDADRRPFDHTVEVMTAGAPPPAAILEGIESLGFNVTQVYGLTETYGHTVMSIWQGKWDDEDFATRAKLKARQGVPLTITEDAAVLDTETGKPVPRDGETIGEIALRGNTVMKGYLKNPEATEAAFKDGYFRSGDLAVMHPDGYIEVRDRLKDIIISGGENISSVEIENALHRHPAVAIAAVVARPDPRWGETPCAFVELKSGQDVTEEELITFSRQHLAGFKIPKKVVFGEIPKTATGKLQKFTLRERIKAGEV